MALISRYHTEASGNTIFAANYNGEFDNIINNGLIPSGIVADGAANVTAMRATSNPGGVGTEVLPVSLSDEIRQIHYVIKQLSGGSQWYDVSVTGLSGKVSGPGSATDNAVTRFDATTGKLIQNSGVIIDDSNNISGLGTLTCTDLSSTGNTTIGDAAGDSLTINAATSISVSSAFANKSHLSRTVVSGTASGNLSISSSASGSFTTSSLSMVDVTNLTATLTVSGRPVVLMLISDNGGSASNIRISKNGTNSVSTIQAVLQFVEGSTSIAVYNLFHDFPADTSGIHQIAVPSSSMHHIYIPSAGTYTWKVQARVTDATNMTMGVTNAKLLVYEL